MATFLSYNTDDSQTGNTPLQANGSVTIGPIMTGVASKVAGSVFSDQDGSFIVQQSFDGGQHWDITSAQVDVTGGTGVSIDEDVIAPMLQVVYTNGSTNQKDLRIFVRVFGSDRSS